MDAKMTHAEKVKRDIVYQTDPRLTPEMNRYGCRVRVLMAIPEFIVGTALTADQINDIVDRGRRIEEVIVNDQMRAGRSEHWLINESFRALGSPRMGRQVGWTSEHVMSKQWEYMISHWETGGPDGHFTLFDRRQSEIFDPHNPMQADGYVINKKRIARRLVYHTWENVS